MPNYAKWNLRLFFSNEDENRFELELKRLFPKIRFVDGSLWETTEPKTQASLVECQSLVFLWNLDACPQLPFQALADGRARVPTSGIVIQYYASAQNQTMLVNRLSSWIDRCCPRYR